MRPRETAYDSAPLGKEAHLVESRIPGISVERDMGHLSEDQVGFSRMNMASNQRCEGSPEEAGGLIIGGGIPGGKRVGVRGIGSSAWTSLSFCLSGGGQSPGVWKWQVCWRPHLVLGER